MDASASEAMEGRTVISDDMGYLPNYIPKNSQSTFMLQHLYLELQQF